MILQIFLLQKLTNTQKKSISKYSRLLCDLRTIATNLTNALDIDSFATNISTIKDKIDILVDSYSYSSIILEQFSSVLKSCPEKCVNLESEPEFDIVLSDAKIVRCYKNSEEWCELYKKIKFLISSVNKHKNALHKVLNTTPKQIGQDLGEVPVLSQSHIDVVNDCTGSLESMVAEIENILVDYQFKLKIMTGEVTPEHPILRSIVDLRKYLKKMLNRLGKLDESFDIPMEDTTTAGEVIILSEDLIASMLLIIQSIYKKHLPHDTNENSEVINAINEIILTDKEREEPRDILEDKHLKELLQDKLSHDSKMLQLDNLISKTHWLLVKYTQYLAIGGKDTEDVKNVVMRLVPILEQTALFVQYFITQKVAVHRVSCKMLSVLLKIFSDLASKG